MRGKLVGFGLPIVAAGLIGASLVFGAGTVDEASGHSSVPEGQAIPTRVLGETLTAVTCPPAGFVFCISGSVAGVGPGQSPQNMTVKLLNPNPFPIFVTSVSMTAPNFGSCPASTTVTSPGWAATDTSPIPTDSVPVGPATSSGPGSATQTISVNWSDSTTKNQTPCLGPTPINVTFGGFAVGSFNCITGSLNGGLTVAAGKVGCVSGSGKVNGGITVPSTSGLVLDPGASVTGGIKALGGASEIMLCGANVNGGVTITKASGPIVIGSGSYCGANNITGGLVLTSNSGGLQVIGNKVTGGYTINSNTSSSAELVESNTGSGGMSCSGNIPALFDGSPPKTNSVSGPKSGQCAGSF